MTAYRLDRFFYLVHTDADFLAKFRSDPASATRRVGLTPEEADAIRGGDVRALYRAGTHPFLLHGLVRHRLSGVDQASYMAQVRDAARATRRRARPA